MCTTLLLIPDGTWLWKQWLTVDVCLLMPCEFKLKDLGIIKRKFFLNQILNVYFFYFKSCVPVAHNILH